MSLFYFTYKKSKDLKYEYALSRLILMYTILNTQYCIYENQYYRPKGLEQRALRVS